jgi:2-methylcitrate dehydratase PrpD
MFNDLARMAVKNRFRKMVNEALMFALRAGLASHILKSMNHMPLSTEQSRSLSSQLATAITSRPVSEADLKAAALFTLDAVANIVAGRNSVQGRKLLAWQNAMSSGNNEHIDKARLSFLYGALCHILEVDDLHRASVVHPGCIVVPTVMSLAGGANGHDVLTAVLRGFEACCRVGMCVGSEHYRIWHNTATCGPYGSAMAAASLLGLDHGETVNALGNAGSQSAGLWEFLDTGAETKHLHAGRGAEAGVVAATLAQHGFTGAPEILEGERGFFKATCRNPNPDLLLPCADDAWQLHMTSMKPWPSCRHTHPTIECGLALHNRLVGMAPVKSVTVSAYPAALALCDREDVNSAYAGKFSLQHCVSTALQDGKVDFDSFEPAARAQLSAARSVVRVEASEPFVSAYPVNWGSKVTVTLQDGSIVSHQVTDARGDPELALSEDDLVQKARGLLHHGGYADTDALIARILGLTEGKPLPDLSGLITC